MHDLISRQAAIETVRKAKSKGKAHRMLIQLPSAQPEIIYCKDCVHHIDGFFCRQANHHTSDKDHCASVFRAKRRTDERSD